MKQFNFTGMLSCFCSFLGESEDFKKTFRNYLTFRKAIEIGEWGVKNPELPTSLIDGPLSAKKQKC